MNRILSKSINRFRHWADQNDRLKYGWTHHDGENFAIEQIHDHHLQMNIQYLKEVTGQHGGDWTTRIQLTPQVYFRIELTIIIDEYHSFLFSLRIVLHRSRYSSIFIMIYRGWKR